jgi:hypothetical protein
VGAVVWTLIVRAVAPYTIAVLIITAVVGADVWTLLLSLLLLIAVLLS